MPKKEEDWSGNVYVEFEATRGDYKKGSTHELSGDLAHHYCEAAKVAKRVAAPKPTNRQHQATSGGGSLNTKNAPGG